MAGARIPEKADIAIVGGGLVGASLALLLARQNLGRILLLEANPFPTAGNNVVDQASFDARSTALSESTRQIFSALGIWGALADVAAPIAQIHVSDRGRPGATRMLAEEEGLPALGYVVENRHLGQVLMSALAKEISVSLVAPARVTSMQPQQGAMQLFTETGACQVQLAVVADGAGSVTLKKLGIGVSCKEYGQTALIANIGLAQPHQGIAYERFTDQGPMALLPLSTTGSVADAGVSRHRMALVWTLSQQQAQQMLSVDDGEFLQYLHQRFGYRAGTFVHVGKKASYPLRLVTAQEQMRRSLVVVGNAAHTLHPVAGQGFNLALRDIANLVEVLSSYHNAAPEREQALGDPAVLQRWLQRQQADQQRTIGFSDLLPSLFAQGNPLAVAGRTLGLVALDLLPTMRSGFTRFGAGLSNPARI